MSMLTQNGNIKTHASWNTYHVIPDDDEGPIHGCASYSSPDGTEGLACGDSPLQYIYPGRLMKNWYSYDWSQIPPEHPSPDGLGVPDFTLYDQPIPPEPKDEKNKALKKKIATSPSEPEYNLEYPDEALSNPREFFGSGKPTQKGSSGSDMPIWVWFLIGGVIALFVILLIWLAARMEKKYKARKTLQVSPMSSYTNSLPNGSASQPPRTTQPQVSAAAPAPQQYYAPTSQQYYNQYPYYSYYYPESPR